MKMSKVIMLFGYFFLASAMYGMDGEFELCKIIENYYDRLPAIAVEEYESNSIKIDEERNHFFKAHYENQKTFDSSFNDFSNAIKQTIPTVEPQFIDQSFKLIALALTTYANELHNIKKVLIAQRLALSLLAGNNVQNAEKLKQKPEDLKEENKTIREDAKKYLQEKNSIKKNIFTLVILSLIFGLSCHYDCYKEVTGAVFSIYAFGLLIR